MGGKNLSRGTRKRLVNNQISSHVKRRMILCLWQMALAKSDLAFWASNRMCCELLNVHVLFLHGPTLAGFKIKSLVGHEPDQGFNDALVF